MTMVGFPLLLIPIAIYNILAFLMQGVSLTDPLFKLTLMSGSDWPVTLSDILLALGVLMLLLEVIKGARPGAKYLTDHLLSFVVFGAAAAEFLLWPKFASSTFFLLTLLAFTDFVSGIALRARRGMQPVVAAAVPRSPHAAAKEDVQAETGADVRTAEPQFEPQPTQPARPPPPASTAPPATPPAPSAPPPSAASASPLSSAASVAESVLFDHPEPKIAPPAVGTSGPQPAVVTNEPSPQMASPELQPGNAVSASPEPPQPLNP
jgi:hypothetical protein